MNPFTQVALDWINIIRASTGRPPISRMPKGDYTVSACPLANAFREGDNPPLAVLARRRSLWVLEKKGDEPHVFPYSPPVEEFIRSFDRGEIPELEA